MQRPPGLHVLVVKVVKMLFFAERDLKWSNAILELVENDISAKLVVV
jgi:hypothetical protein